MHLPKLQVYGLTTNQREREEINTDYGSCSAVHVHEHAHTPASIAHAYKYRR